jgi:hypothetical protein
VSDWSLVVYVAAFAGFVCYGVAYEKGCRDGANRAAKTAADVARGLPHVRFTAIMSLLARELRSTAKRAARPETGALQVAVADAIDSVARECGFPPDTPAAIIRDADSVVAEANRIVADLR